MRFSFSSFSSFIFLSLFLSSLLSTPCLFLSISLHLFCSSPSVFFFCSLFLLLMSFYLSVSSPYFLPHSTFSLLLSLIFISLFLFSWVSVFFLFFIPSCQSRLGLMLRHKTLQINLHQPGGVVAVLSLSLF